MISHQKCEKARSGPDVGHYVGGFEVEGIKQQIGAFFAFALRAFEPRRAEMTHHVRNFPTLVELADPVAAGFAEVVHIRGVGGGRRCCLLR